MAILLFLFFLSRFLICQFILGLHGDEAYWWMQTKHLNAGYFDHPPFIAFELFALIKLFGDSPLAMRIGSIFFSTASILLIYFLSIEIFKNKKWAFLTALLVAVLPITNYQLNLVHNDPPFIFFWLLTILFIWKAVSKKSTGFWYLAGISAGFLLLCKLQALILLPCLFVFLLISGENRHWLKRKEPYLALLIMILLFLPTLIWYALHDFEPIAFQLSSRSGITGFSLIAYIESVIGHVFWEAVWYSPFVYLLSIFAIFYGGFLAFKGKDQRFLFLFWLSAPIIVLFTLAAGLPHWSFCAHIISLIAAMGGIPILVSKASRQNASRIVYLGLAGSCFLLALVMTMASFYYFSTIKLNDRIWTELCKEIEATDMFTQEASKLYLVGPNNYIIAEIAYHEREQFAGYSVAFMVYEHKALCQNSDYSPWASLDSLVGENMIFVDEKENLDATETPVAFWIEKLDPYFERVEDPTIIDVGIGGREPRTFYIFEAYGFKGPDDHINCRGELRQYLDGSSQ